MKEELTLEEKIRKLSKGIIECSRKEFRDYMDWFFTNTEGSDLYKNEREGVALANLLYRTSKMISIGRFFHGSIPKGAVESLADDEIPRIAFKTAKALAEREVISLLHTLNPLAITKIPDKKLNEYHETLVQYNRELEPRLREMYGAWRASKKSDREQKEGTQ